MNTVMISTQENSTTLQHLIKLKTVNELQSSLLDNDIRENKKKQIKTQVI